MRRIPSWIFLRVFLALVAAAALVIVTAVELHSASGGLSKWQLISLAAVAGLFGPIESVARTFKDWSGYVEFQQRLNVEEAAKGAIVALTKVTPLPYTAIGITVFVTRRAHGHLIEGIQERIVRFRIESTPRPSTVIWTKNKGILGKCWRENRDAALDHRVYFDRFADISKADWKKLPDVDRMGLSYRDFKDVREYGYVLASPMRDLSGRYRGCFVVQVPSEGRIPMESLDALEVVHTFAATTCDVLK